MTNNLNQLLFYLADVYHSTFDPPTDSAVVQRLVPDPKSSEKVMKERLMEYHRLCLVIYMYLTSS